MPINWSNGGVPAINDVNLGQLAVIPEIGTPGTPTGDAIAAMLTAPKIAFSATGYTSTNVQDALVEVLGYTDDSGDYWSNTTKTLSVTAGTYVTDADLNVPILANQTAMLDYYLTFSGATSDTANLRAQLLAPSGATAAWGSALDWNAAGSSGTAKQSLGALTDVRTFKLNVAPTGVHIIARVINGSTAGTISIQLAPDTTTATAVVRDAWSNVAVRKAM